MPIPAIPESFNDLVRVYGDPRQFMRPDGTLSPTWESKHITRVPMPLPLPLDGTMQLVTQLTCHVLLADLMEEVMNALDDRGLWNALASYGGGFCYRPQRGSSRLSLHTWGLAWDFDASHNQLGSDPSTWTINRDAVELFKTYGFTWGGDFHGRKDPMHVQWCRNY